MIKDVSAVASYLEEQVKKATDLAVIGISGGVDSSVVAAICVAALGPKAVFLLSMPYDDIDRKSFNARSARLAEQLSAVHYTIPIAESCLALEGELNKVFLSSDSDQLHWLTRANIRPRVRMNVLYSVAREVAERHSRQARVMGTGHLSEDLIGYDTKGGDALCDIFILSELVKSEVYQLAEYYQIPKEIAEAEPSAGLFEGQTDKDELGYTYRELESATLAVFHALQAGVPRVELSQNDPRFKGIDPKTLRFVIERYQANYHKHEAPTTVALRKFVDWFA